MNNSHLGCDIIEETDDSEHMTQVWDFSWCHVLMHDCIRTISRHLFLLLLWGRLWEVSMG